MAEFSPSGYQEDNEFHDSFQTEEDANQGEVLSRRGMFAAGSVFLSSVRKEKKRERYQSLKTRKYASERVLMSSDDGVDQYDIIASSSDGAMPTFSNADINKNSYGSFTRRRPSILRDELKQLELSPIEVLWNMIFGSYINLLLLFSPIAVASYYLKWSPTSIFIFNFLTMIPLAAILGDFTEEAAAHTNQTIGGLINASFGNAVEVVVAIEALYKGEYRVVQASMIGSIFSNLLLVLGCCFFFGGLIYDEQKYSQLTATSNMGLLGLSAIALVLPTPFAAYYEINEEDALIISRIAAMFLIFMYAQLLYFQLKTHAKFFEDEDDEEPTLPFSVAICGLVVVTLIIAKLSDFLVGSIDGFCEESGISKTFTGLIIIPIVGNAVEHMTAVSVAMKDKMDLAMGVAVGSSTQISLFVTPLIVIVGWVADLPMTLNFPGFEIILFILSVVIVSIIVSYPKSNWLEGSLLITTYIMIAVGFWFEKVVSYQSPTSSEL